jgi:hypothetical protein
MYIIRTSQDATIVPVLASLRSLFALYEIETRAGEFMLNGYFSTTHILNVATLVLGKCMRFLRTSSPHCITHPQIRKLLAQLRPNAVALVSQ